MSTIFFFALLMMLRYSLATTSMSNLFFACCLQVLLEIDPTFFTAAIISSFVFTLKPVIPSSITSFTEPALKPMTGVPQAMASTITIPKGSSHSIGNNKAFAFPNHSFFWASFTVPIYFICCPSIWGKISFS